MISLEFASVDGLRSEPDAIQRVMVVMKAITVGILQPIYDDCTDNELGDGVEHS